MPDTRASANATARTAPRAPGQGFSPSRVSRGLEKRRHPCRNRADAIVLGNLPDHRGAVDERIAETTRLHGRYSRARSESCGVSSGSMERLRQLVIEEPRANIALTKVAPPFGVG